MKQYTPKELKQLDWQQKLDAAIVNIKFARTQLMFNNPFWGVLCLFMPVIAQKGLKTVATDGRNFLFDPDYLLCESIEDLLFDFKHEAAHIILQHLAREGKRQAVAMTPNGPVKVFNMAADYAIHSLFKQCSEYFPANVLFDPAYNGMTAECIYDLLVKQAQKNKQKGGGGNIPGKGDSSGYLNTNGQKQADDHGQWSKAASMSQKDAESTATDWRDRVANALATAKAAGKLPGALEAWASDLLNPKVDWRTLVGRFFSRMMGGDYVWHQPDRRFLYDDIYLPGMESTHIKLFAFIDTSGSMSREAVIEMMTETEASVQSADSYDLHVVYFDSRPYLHESFSSTDKFRPPKKLSRGGTNFRAAFDYLLDTMIAEHGKPDVIVFFTDGYDTWPKDPIGIPTLALITEHDSTPEWIDAIMYSEIDD